jgi:multiple sugar transport system permease protein
MVTRLLKRRIHIGKFVVWVIGMAVTILWLIPILWMFVSSLKPEASILSAKPELIPKTTTLEHYKTLLDYPIVLWFRNSVIVSVVTTLLVLITSCPAGYAFARLEFKGKTVIFVIVLASLMMPFQTMLIPLYLLVVRMGINRTLLAQIVPWVLSPFSIYVFRNFFYSLPKELEDAAAIDGCSKWGTFFRVALPLAKPAVLILTVTNFVGIWNAFLWPLIVSTRETKPLAVGVTRFNPSVGDSMAALRFGPAMAAAGLLAIPSLLIYLLLQRYLVEGISTSGIKG